jgi:hypothetical protein
MSSTDPRARKAYLRLGYGAPPAERLETLPALGKANRCCQFPGAADSPLALWRGRLAKLSSALAMARTAPLAA